MSELLAEICVAQRVELVQAILSTISIENAEETTLTATKVAIIEKRAAEISANLVSAVPWEKVQRKLIECYGLYS